MENVVLKCVKIDTNIHVAALQKAHMMGMNFQEFVNDALAKAVGTESPVIRMRASVNANRSKAAKEGWQNRKEMKSK
jgi:hypothetical protein